MSRDNAILLDNEATFGSNADGLFIRYDQEIPQSFLDGLHSERLAKAAVRAGDYHAVADVPTAVVELWQRQGLDFWKMTPRQIVSKLRQDDLHYFISTPKAV